MSDPTPAAHGDVEVGFVGLGSQGGPMAMRIAEVGWPLSVWARRPAAVANVVAAGASAVSSLAELGAVSTMVGVCVTTDDDVREVVLGTGGVLSSMEAGSTIAIHSTVHPDTVREVEAQAAVRGVDVLDAPVSGGGAGAAAGRLAVLMGGPPAVADRWRPVLSAFASTIELVGPVGAGQLAKLLNNALAAITLGSSLRAVAAAEELGLDRDRFLRLVMASSGDSFMLRAVPHFDSAGSQLAAERLRKDVDLLDRVAPTEVGDTAALVAVADASVGHVETLSARGRPT